MFLNLTNQIPKYSMNSVQSQYSNVKETTGSKGKKSCIQNQQGTKHSQPVITMSIENEEGLNN